LCIAVEIAEGGRQAVTAMLQGRPADRDRQTTRPFATRAPPPDSLLQSGYAPLPSRTRRHYHPD
jgi:hypothetical protein